MATKQLEVSGIPIEVVRKDIKNLHLSVHPPNGHVRVAAPNRLSDDRVRVAIVSRLGWIRKQQNAITDQARQSQREMVRGESHFVQGRRYRLEVIEENKPPSVSLRNGRIMELRVRPGTERSKRETILQEWYRGLLREEIPRLHNKWEHEIGVNVNECRIRRMKTRWGSCNIRQRRIWLNLELAKKPTECLEYVFVHELVHLLERKHNDRFRNFMDQFLPDWRRRREELNRAPLAHEEWVY